jgi:hypothetical protein
MKETKTWIDYFFPILLLGVFFSHGPFLLMKWLDLKYLFDIPLLLLIIFSNKLYSIKKKDIPLYVGFIIYSISFLGQEEYVYFLGVLFGVLMVIVIQNINKYSFNKFCDFYIYFWVFLSLHIVLTCYLFVTGAVSVEDLSTGPEHIMSELTLYFGSVSMGGIIPFPEAPIRFKSYFKEPSNMVVFQIFFMLLTIYRQRYAAMVFVFIIALALSYSLNLFVFLAILIGYFISYFLVRNHKILLLGYLLILWLILASGITIYFVEFVEYVTGQRTSGSIRATFYTNAYGEFTVFGSRLSNPVGMLFDFTYIGIIPFLGIVLIFSRKLHIPRNTFYNCSMYSFLLSMLLVQYYGAVGFTLVIFLGVLYKISKLSHALPQNVFTSNNDLQDRKI